MLPCAARAYRCSSTRHLRRLAFSHNFYSPAAEPQLHTKDLQQWVENPSWQGWAEVSHALIQTVPIRMAWAAEGLNTAQTRLGISPLLSSGSSHTLHRQELSRILTAACQQVLNRKRAFEAHKQSLDGQPAESSSGSLAGGKPTPAQQAQLLRAADAVYGLRTQLEEDFTQVVGSLRVVAEQTGWWKDDEATAAVDASMDLLQGHLLAMRLLLGEALCCWARLRRSQGLSGLGLQGVTEGDGLRAADRWSTAGPRGPPGWELEEARPPPSLLMPNAPVVTLLRLATEDVRAFAVDKVSIAPEVEITGEEQLTITCVDAWMTHVYSEVLKNAMGAVVRKYGAWDVDEAPPIAVEVTPLAAPARGVRISITDFGGGMPPEDVARGKHWLSSSHAERPPGYGYSKQHGAQFQGLGVGLPSSLVYATFMGGSLTTHSNVKAGTTCVVLELPADGFSF